MADQIVYQQFLDRLSYMGTFLELDLDVVRFGRVWFRFIAERIHADLSVDHPSISNEEYSKSDIRSPDCGFCRNFLATDFEEFQHKVDNKIYQNYGL